MLKSVIITIKIRGLAQTGGKIVYVDGTSRRMRNRNLIVIAAGSFLAVLAWQALRTGSVVLPDPSVIGLFKTMFIGIVLEAVPFIMLGVVLSSFMQVYIPETWIRKAIPRNPFLGLVFACLLGILFPICECGMIPVVRRLINKGMPLYIGVVVILAGPVVNPVVYAATYTAFRMNPEMVYARMGLALGTGALIGLFVYAFINKNPLKHRLDTLYSGNGQDCAHAQGSGKFLAMTSHAGTEFFDMGKYLIFGSLITAVIQAFVPRGDLSALGEGEVLPHLFMMGFAYILSLCSTSDAFVASSFLQTFSKGSLLTFLVFGPMLDFKSTLMLLSVFKTKFVLLLALLITVTVFAGSVLVEHLFFR
ncbi:permease [Paenibacillus sp. UNC499MF]|uniref:permease n=1 Tax=Paenibacillus sp. UNC499MF TaxID=1502751 RepID=UPI00215613E4|nr:permease [Paenibacillus sp. UNC499MF]